MSLSNRKCGEIELFRFVFSLIIMFRHSQSLRAVDECFAGGGLWR